VLDTVLLALAASLCWGAADFTAGLKARTVALPVVLLVSQGVGFAIALLIVVVSQRPAPGVAQELAGLGGGAGGIAGLACFYRALATGTMSVVAPRAATGGVIPGVAGGVGGDHLAAIQVLGMLAAVVGVVLSSRHPDPDPESADRRLHRRGVKLALLAAVGFGSYFLLAHIAARGGVGWLLLNAHITTVLGVLIAALFMRSTLRAPGRADLGVLALAGAVDLAATGLYGIANRHGQLSIVAVAGSLYPVATVLLARSVLRERVARLQAVGVGLALAGVALIAA
jgi:drug/metabolite transporter (DMT)-like permease